MKKFFKKFIPNSVLVIWRRRNRRTKIRNKSAKDVFTEIYKSNLWGSSESISGTGSVKEQTESLINELDKLLKDMNISSRTSTLRVRKLFVKYFA